MKIFPPKNSHIVGGAMVFSGGEKVEKEGVLHNGGQRHARAEHRHNPETHVGQGRLFVNAIIGHNPTIDHHQGIIVGIGLTCGRKGIRERRPIDQ